MTELTPPRRRRKLHRSATPYVFAFYMSAIMALLMCFVITAANSGINTQYLANVLRSYQLAMPVAFICVLIVRPVVIRLVALTVQHQ
ncbi:DUF2798 domain-containing protein [Pseudomonas sp. CCOS 191]|uniref:DUF2798 domain-containing protein n=1 Tax=Pseudomonas sp. CCOS 191 TaxID=1649877 RepID=UPI0018E6D2C8|nr:DUF2798 domain-containing protein [Pseudomonas sp. CCOS 191]MBI6951652.1 DUF2798 domain-containing protein [Pseudomonas sp. CCOS 191]